MERTAEELSIRWSKQGNCDQSLFTDGYAMVKFKNVDVNGNAGSDPTGDFPDTDFPMFRLADVYLMYAEAVLRGGQGGSVTQATDYINILRSRAYGNSNGNISTAQLTLDFILDERARELYWEGHRRTDLILLWKIHWRSLFMALERWYSTRYSN